MTLGIKFATLSFGYTFNSARLLLALSEFSDFLLCKPLKWLSTPFCSFSECSSWMVVLWGLNSQPFLQCENLPIPTTAAFLSVLSLWLLPREIHSALWPGPVVRIPVVHREGTGLACRSEEKQRVPEIRGVGHPVWVALLFMSSE